MATPTVRTAGFIDSLTVNTINLLSAETGDTLFFIGNELTTLPAGPVGQVITSAGPGLPLIFSPPGGAESAAGEVETKTLKVDKLVFNTDSKIRLASKTIVDWLPPDVRFVGGTNNTPSTSILVTEVSSGKLYIGMPLQNAGGMPFGPVITAFGIPTTAAIGYIGVFVLNPMTGLMELSSNNVFTRLTPTNVTLTITGSLPLGTINVTSTDNFPSVGSIVVATDAGPQVVNYTAVIADAFVGCSGGVGNFIVTGLVTIQPIRIGTTVTEIGGGIVATAKVVSIDVTNTFYTLDKSLVIEESTIIFMGTAEGDVGLYTIDIPISLPNTTVFKSDQDPGLTFLNNMYWGQNSGIASTGVQNTAVGHNALESVVEGGDNTAVGFNALNSLVGTFLTDGFQNTATGALSMRDTSTGSRNTAAGYQTLIVNTTQNDNTAVGCLAMQNNIVDNTSAFGSQAMLNNTTGTGNSAFGYRALMTNTTGNDNTAIGQNALEFLDGNASITGHDNIAIGNLAMNMATTGSENLAIGNNTLLVATTADNNTAIGNNTLATVDTGMQNTAVGNSALEFGDNTDATAVGYAAAQNGGNEITAVGAWALTNNIPVLSTTAAGPTLNLPQATITVVATAGWPPSGSFFAVSTSGIQFILYTGLTATTFLNCVGGLGQIIAGNLVTGGGINNTALGWAALRDNVSGCGNTAVGNNSLTANMGSDNNTAFGFDTLSTALVGSHFNAFGAGALASATGNPGARFTGSVAKIITTTNGVHVITVAPFTLTVLNTTNFLGTGSVVVVGNTLTQVITYTSKTATQFLNCVAPAADTANSGVIVTDNETSTLTVSAVASGSIIVNNKISGLNVSSLGSYVLNLLTGTGLTGTYRVSSGYAAASTTMTATASGNSAFGAFALTNATTGMDNIAIGNNSGMSIGINHGNVIIGNNADVTGQIDGALVLGNGASTGNPARALAININKDSVIPGVGIDCLINGEPARLSTIETPGSVYNVATGLGLTGGPITTTGTISMLSNQFQVNAGSGLVGGGATTLGNALGLSLSDGTISYNWSSDTTLTITAGTRTNTWFRATSALTGAQSLLFTIKYQVVLSQISGPSSAGLIPAPGSGMVMSGAVNGIFDGRNFGGNVAQMFSDNRYSSNHSFGYGGSLSIATFGDHLYFYANLPAQNVALGIGYRCKGHYQISSTGVGVIRSDYFGVENL